jgi:hypothetical protein
MILKLLIDRIPELKQEESESGSIGFTAKFQLQNNHHC